MIIVLFKNTLYSLLTFQVTFLKFNSAVHTGNQRKLTVRIVNTVCTAYIWFCTVNAEITVIVALIPTPEDRIAYIFEEYDLDDIDLEELSESILSEFKQSVIEYKTGYAVMKLSSKINCNHCKEQLRAKEPCKQNFIGEKD